MLFHSKKKPNNEGSLGIKYGTIHIKQRHTVTYLDVALNEDLLGKPLALKFIKRQY